MAPVGAWEVPAASDTTSRVGPVADWMTTSDATVPADTGQFLPVRRLWPEWPTTSTL